MLATLSGLKINELPFEARRIAHIAPMLIDLRCHILLQLLLMLLVVLYGGRFEHLLSLRLRIVVVRLNFDNFVVVLAERVRIHIRLEQVVELLGVIVMWLGVRCGRGCCL